MADGTPQIIIQLVGLFIGAISLIYASKSVSVFRRLLGIAAAFVIAAAGLFLSDRSVIESLVMGIAFVVVALIPITIGRRRGVL